MSDETDCVSLAVERERAALQVATTNVLQFVIHIRDLLYDVPGDHEYLIGEAHAHILALRAALGEDMAMDPGWVRIGQFDSARRRALWVKFNEESIELKGGREGNDSHVVIDKSNPSYEALRGQLAHQVGTQTI